MYDPYSEFAQYSLPNGLEIHHAFWDRPWVTAEVVIHSASKDDPLHLPGVAHFVEHMVSQNIPGMSKDAAVGFLDSIGGKAMWGSTNYLVTRYGFSVPAHSEELLMTFILFGLMLLEARLSNSFDREKSVIYEEFKQRYPFPEKLEWEMRMRRNAFSGHRLETWNRPLGRPEGFLNATPEDLQAFYDEHYTPANISLVVLGGVQAQELLQFLAESPFGKKKAGKRNAIPLPAVLPPDPVVGQRVKMSDFMTLKVEQTDYSAIWAFPIGVPPQTLRIFCSVLNFILNDEVREKRSLAYSIQASYCYFQDLREFVVKAKVNPSATDEIDALVLDCIKQVPVRFDIFSRKLEAVKRRLHMIDLSGAALVDDTADDLELFQRVVTAQETLAELEAVTFDQMSEIASLLDVSRQYTLIIRP